MFLAPPHDHPAQTTRQSEQCGADKQNRVPQSGQCRFGGADHALAIAVRYMQRFGCGFGGWHGRAVGCFTMRDVLHCLGIFHTTQRDDDQRQQCGHHPAHHQRNRHALENRIRQDHGRADHQRKCCDDDRSRAGGASVDHRVFDGHAFGHRLTREIHQQDRIAHNNPGQRDKADHRGGGERCAKQPVAGHDADQG